MPRHRTLSLSFSPGLARMRPGKSLCDGLSAALQIGSTLWLANDESATVERLTLRRGSAGDHVQFDLGELLRLPVPREQDSTPEIDIEGMDFADGWLWVTGSHSRKRCKPEARAAGAAQDELADVSSDANRYVLARLPVIAGEDGLPTLAREDGRGKGKRRAAMLKAAPHGNALTHALRKDRHLAGFMGLPGKENGFDIEGLAVAGDRVWLGLRGPVLGGWATVLQLRLRAGGKHGLRLGRLTDGPRERVRKHFLDLGGLGVRDLCIDGDDMLLLAGPTMGLDGPVRIYRWPGATRCRGPRMVPRDALELVLDIPTGEGCDHAEGMTLLQADQPGIPTGMLVVYDRCAPARRTGPSRLVADVFSLPRR